MRSPTAPPKPPPKVKISKISQSGIISIKFSKKMMNPPDVGIISDVKIGNKKLRRLAETSDKDKAAMGAAFE